MSRQTVTVQLSHAAWDNSGLTGLPTTSAQAARPFSLELDPITGLTYLRTFLPERSDVL